MGVQVRRCARCGAQVVSDVCLRCLCAADPAPIAIPGIELGDEIGRGGSATVYSGRRIADDRAVAVKLFQTDFEQDAASTARFHREAALLQSLPHPNILAIEGWGEIDLAQTPHSPAGSAVHPGRADLRRYIVTELAAGGPVSDRIPLEQAAALEVVHQVCAALAFAHAHGIVHRDVKPHNVLIAADGIIKLGDFGAARQLGLTVQPITETGDIIGTPYYIAPEAMHGAPNDPRMDIYAVGVLLYHLITGTLPIGYFEPLHGALDPVVRRALAHNPDRRYGTVSELSDALRRAVADPIPTIAAPVAQGRRRRRSVAAAVVIAIALSTALVAWSAWSRKGNGVEQAWIASAATGVPPLSGPKASASTEVIHAGIEAHANLPPSFESNLPPDVDAGAVGPTPRNGETYNAHSEQNVSRAELSAEGNRSERTGDKTQEPRGADKRAPLAGGDKRAAMAGGDKRAAMAGDDKRAPLAGGDKRAAMAGDDKRTPLAGGDKRAAMAGDDKRAPPGVADGTIIIAARPWAEVHIDGVPRGRAEPPTTRFRVEPGAHTVTLSHPITGKQTTRKVTVENRAAVEIRADLGRDSTEPSP